MIPKLVKLYQYTCDQAEEGKCIRLYQDEAGWYYMHAFIPMEGFHTPFSSIEEIVLSQGLTGMKKTTELEVTEEMYQLIKQSWENVIKQYQDNNTPDEDG